MKLSEKAEGKKEQLIIDLVAARKRILDEAATLPLKAQDQVFLGSWSVRDLLAHLIGWDFTNIQAAQEILSGALPSFYAYHDRDWKTYNAELVTRYKQGRFTALLASAQKSNQQLAEYLKTIPANEFATDRDIRFRGFKVTIERLLQAEARDEGVHYLQIKEFRENSGE